MTHPKLIKFMGAHKMYPRKKVDSCFILFQMVVKKLILKIFFFFFFTLFK